MHTQTDNYLLLTKEILESMSLENRLLVTIITIKKLRKSCQVKDN